MSICDYPAAQDASNIYIPVYPGRNPSSHQCIQLGRRLGHAAHPQARARKSIASIRKWSSHKSGTGVPTSAHYTWYLVEPQEFPPSELISLSGARSPTCTLQASWKPRHPAAAAAAAASHLCPCDSSPSPGHLQRRTLTPEARGPAQALPLLKGEPSQCVLTIPNPRQETGSSCIGRNRRKPSRCTFQRRNWTLLRTSCSDDTWCHLGVSDTSQHLQRN
ncbi:uncharacterized protein LOC123515083 isoform X2 [Portunus trituberculatus]|uniref:uncharacterized protein LOC123515083 isoform X2 n=1 Tax=Portunus trituberculatus TaxID=210409 RepID=UPI001E1CE70E|nr:uncharacterized protein LOC123515083 isoform X2 [Portunus trituberculatus]